MLKIRGFAIQQALIVLAIILAMSGLVYAWKSYTDGLVEEGHARGVSETRASFAERDNAALQDALAKLKAATDAAAATERKAREALRQQAAKHTEEMKNADLRTKSLVAAATAGSLVLRDPGPRPAVPADGGGTAAGAAGAPPAGPAAAGGAKLSGEAAAFLLSLTGEADDLARRYNRLLGHHQVTAETCRGNP